MMVYKMIASLKKIAAFFLLLIGAMPILFTLLFLIRQQMIRYNMREKLEEQLLCTIILTNSEVDWVKNNKEIRVNNKLFDIKSFTVKNGHYVFTGLFDEDETALNKTFNNDLNEKDEQENQSLVELSQLLQSLYSGDPSDVLAINNELQKHAHPILLYIPSPIKNILTPPPQF